MDTTDIVQDTMVRFRQALINRIRRQLRNATVRPANVPLSPEFVDDGPSPLETAIG